MGDIKLFNYRNNQVNELVGSSVALEKTLQQMIEANLETVLGVTFLASEYSTGDKHRGRIDTLGIDESGAPVIIEYKRSLNENVINQGLFYLDWLLDHKETFQWLVMEQIDQKRATEVDWTTPRLICIAGDYTRYDLHAVEQINRHIELIRYRRFGDDLLMFDLVSITQPTSSDTPKGKYKGITEYFRDASRELKDLVEMVDTFALSLGDEVIKKELKYYFAYRRMRHFLCLEITSRELRLYLKVPPEEVDQRFYDQKLARDVTNIGHYGTGNLELRIKTLREFELIKELIVESYEKG